ncbi:hypothetical protein FOG48_03172 [Hanseniaspora uvarum]|nr:hypothetical protein FOG48_03172 [Hanseniaspora uvarum]
MTVSAVCKFKPRPPALVDNKKQKYSESGALNSFNITVLSSVLVPPSNLKCLMFNQFKKSCMISMTVVIWKNINTL